VVDEQLEQLFIDIVKVWSTLLGSPASDFAGPGALSCYVPPSARRSTVEGALGAHHRLTRSVMTQSVTEIGARSSKRSTARDGLAW